MLAALARSSRKRDIQQDVDAKVEQATEINGHPLTGNINLEPKDLGAIRTVNGAAPDENGDVLLNFTSGIPEADRLTSAVFTYNPSGLLVKHDRNATGKTKNSTYSYDGDRISGSIEITWGSAPPPTAMTEANMTGFNTVEVSA